MKAPSLTVQILGGLIGGLAVGSVLHAVQAPGETPLVAAADAIGAGHQEDKLIPSDPCGKVGRPRAAGQNAGDGPEHLIARGVAFGVVDLLEVIAVDVRGRDRRTVPLCGCKESDGLLPQRAMVGQTGQAVGAGERGLPFEQLTNKRRNLGHQHERANT